MFQSTLPRRERRIKTSGNPHNVGFQSTLPRRERRRGKGNREAQQRFNPRSHAGSDDIDFSIFSRCGVSIHAPTQGATEKAKTERWSGKWFQSTLPRRERRRTAIRKHGKALFQSTLPRRERRRERHPLRGPAQVSIHAPTQGATRTVLSFFAGCASFNPRSHAGSD